MNPQVPLTSKWCTTLVPMLLMNGLGMRLMVHTHSTSYIEPHGYLAAKSEMLSVYKSMGHSMSNQHKQILTPTDLNENWFLHSVS